MTRIEDRKTRLVAVTSVVPRRRPLVVTLQPYSLLIREKGRRKQLEVSWGSVYTLAATQAANQRRAERAGRLKSGKG